MGIVPRFQCYEYLISCVTSVLLVCWKVTIVCMLHKVCIMLYTTSVCMRYYRVVSYKCVNVLQV